MYRAFAASKRGVSYEKAGEDFKMGNKAFLIRKAAAGLRRMNEKTLRACLNILIDADRQLKSPSANQKIIIEKLVLSLIYAVKTGDVLD